MSKEMNVKRTKQNRYSNKADDLAYHLRRVSEEFCKTMRWLDHEERVPAIDIAQDKMFRVISNLEALMKRVKKFQKQTGERKYVDEKTSKSQEKLFGVIHELEKFSAIFDKANAAADELNCFLDEFDPQVDFQINKLRSSKRNLKSWN
jgi:hypothetical protein